jgi:hypothetical protein
MTSTLSYNAVNGALVYTAMDGKQITQPMVWDVPANVMQAPPACPEWCSVDHAADPNDEWASGGARICIGREERFSRRLPEGVTAEATRAAWPDDAGHIVIGPAAVWVSLGSRCEFTLDESMDLICAISSARQMAKETNETGELNAEQN